MRITWWISETLGCERVSFVKMLVQSSRWLDSRFFKGNEDDEKKIPPLKICQFLRWNRIKKFINLMVSLFFLSWRIGTGRRWKKNTVRGKHRDCRKDNFGGTKSEREKWKRPLGFRKHHGALRANEEKKWIHPPVEHRWLRKHERRTRVEPTSQRGKKPK